MFLLPGYVNAVCGWLKFQFADGTMKADGTGRGVSLKAQRLDEGLEL